jgi:hypothetical protein
MVKTAVFSRVVCTLTLLLASPVFGQPERKPAPPGQAQRITVTIGWGDSREKCQTGRGICIVIATRCRGPARMAGSAVQAEAHLEGNELALEMTSSPPAKTDRPSELGQAKLAVRRDVPLDGCTSAALGYESLTILKGEYAVNSAAGKFGTVKVRVSGKKSSGPPKE